MEEKQYREISRQSRQKRRSLQQCLGEGEVKFLMIPLDFIKVET